MRRLLPLLIILLTTGITVYSQKIKKVSATYTYYAPETMSVEEAKRTALERAKIQAIADEFGTIVSQSTSSIVKNCDAQSGSSFFSIGGSEVRGEWIYTLGDPEYDITYEQDMLVVKVKVRGEAREIKTAAISLDVRTLKNGITLKSESSEFKNNDELYLYFKSPENGFLAVFLLDEATTDVSMLLPYEHSSLSSYPIKRGKSYVFFSGQTCENYEAHEVENYILMCNGDTEYNSVYVVFSPEKFTSPLSEVHHLDVPVITYEKFNKWLTHNRKRDKRMNVVTLPLKISK